MAYFWYTNAKPVQFHNCNDSVTRVVRNLRVPTKRSRYILQQAKGITLIESTQIRWFSRWSGGGGWSGRAKLCESESAKSLKTKGQGTFRLPLKWTTAEADRLGATGPNKRATLTTYLLKERDLKAALHWSARQTGKGKRQPAKEKASRLKRKNAYSRLQKLLLQKIRVVKLMRV